MEPCDLRFMLSVPPSNREKYYKQLGIDCKPKEYEDIRILVKKLLELNTELDLNDFYSGYNIKQIAKEFDLLRFGKNYDINIELKSTRPLPKKGLSTNERIIEQLIQNKYYLGVRGKEIFQFTFISDEEKVFETDGINLIESSLQNLEKRLLEQETERVEIDTIFTPSQFLISPINTPDKFLKKEYFLTDNQKEIKNEILKSDELEYSVVIGRAGTGKTLLIYDLAIEYKAQGKSVTIIHSGQKDLGHNLLIGQGLDIESPKEFMIQSHKVDVLIIDEAQRTFMNQYKQILDSIKGKSIKLIIAGDDNQVLSEAEKKTDITHKLSLSENYKEYKLTQKIRTNKEIAKFIEGIFSLKKMEACNSGNIKVMYFNTKEDTYNFVEYLKCQNYEYITYTIPRYGIETKLISEAGIKDIFSKNAHKVIGQEFDQVVMTIGPHFLYDEQGFLRFENDGSNHYSARQMLLQGLTRARQKLIVIIFENEQVYSKLLEAMIGENQK